MLAGIRKRRESEALASPQGEPEGTAGGEARSGVLVSRA